MTNDTQASEGQFDGLKNEIDAKEGEDTEEATDAEEGKDTEEATDAEEGKDTEEATDAEEVVEGEDTGEGSSDAEEDSPDEPHYTSIPARCPKCPPGEGDLELVDSSVFAIDRVAMDVHCNNCGYDGSAINRLTDFEDKNNGYASAVKNDDAELKYERY